MPHSVTVTRTTTTTNTSAILLNTGYCKTVPGLLKLIELILAAICVILASINITNVYLYTSSPLIFFLVVCSAFLIGTFCLILACILSISTASIIQKTLYEVIYYALAFALVLAAGITFFVDVNSRYNNKYGYSNSSYTQCVTAAIISLILSGLYLVSTVLALRLYKL